jgi:1,4-alpha-glucan branching enzyme
LGAKPIVFFDEEHKKNREYYQKMMSDPERREKARQRSRAYYQKNKAHLREMQKKWLARNPGFSTASKLRTIHRDPERHRARTIAGRYVTLGSNCSKCGTTENLEGHHEDYSILLAVTTLCKQCHEARHLELKLQGKEIPRPSKEELWNRHCSNCGKTYPSCSRGAPSYGGRPCNLWLQRNDKEEKP